MNSRVHMNNYMDKRTIENITWSVMGKQTAQAKKVYWESEFYLILGFHETPSTVVQCLITGDSSTD